MFGTFEQPAWFANSNRRKTRQAQAPTRRRRHISLFFGLNGFGLCVPWALDLKGCAISWSLPGFSEPFPFSEPQVAIGSMETSRLVNCSRGNPVTPDFPRGDARNPSRRESRSVAAFFCLKQSCLEAISTKGGTRSTTQGRKVRGRFAEGCPPQKARRRDVIDLLLPQLHLLLPELRAKS